MPSDIKEAARMIDLFTSVGATSFVVTKTDVDQNKIWGKPYSPRELREKLPAMVRTAADRKPYYSEEAKMVSAGENLIVRPTGPEMAFVQLDDLSVGQLDRVRDAAFLIIATSPGNHQAWIAVSDTPTSGEPFKAFMRRVRNAVGGNDKSASHATRVAGTENFKVKYFPDYPVISIVHGVPGRVMTPERLREMGLLAEPEPVLIPPARGFVHKLTSGHGRSWPDYERCVEGAPLNHAKDGPDISKADFFFAMLASQRGRSIEEIAGKLMDLSSKARKNGEQYARVTAENATAAADRGRQRSRD